MLKTFLAAALVALSLMTVGARAYAQDPTGEYSGYPPWAQDAFESDGGA
jgi:hypothetical protein